MSFAPVADTRSFAFGEPEGELAGTATVWDGGSCSSFAPLLRGEGSGAEEEWRLTGEGVALTFTPVGAPAELELAEAGVTEVHQLAHVQGTVVLDGHEVAIDCAGARARRLGRLDGKRFESLRVVSAWFGGENGLAVLAARPRRARGHDGELLAAVMVEGGVPVPVTDPRLSTTYSADGVPARVGLELWFGEGDDEHARRAAGEAIGRSAVCNELSLRSELLRCRMRGREGIGVYDLVRAG